MRRLILPLAAALAISTQPLLAAPAPPFVFSRPAIAPTVAPRAAELADLDADGRTDLVSAVGNSCCPTSIGISVMRGRDDGSFHPATVSITSTLPDDLELLDLDGTGTLDAVAALRLQNSEPGSYTAVALPGNGDGTFGETVDLSFPTFSTMAVGRFREGGAVSAVLSTDGGLAVWDQYFGLNFTDAGLLDPGTAGRLLAADLDADGRDELLAYGDEMLTLYRGRTAAASIALTDVVGLRAADVTGDGLPEVVATQSGGQVRAFGPNLGAVKSFLSNQSEALQSNVGELDGDGIPDVVRANTDASVTVFFGKGGSLPRIPLAQIPTDVFVRDATGDGLADILALETGASIVEVLDGDGAGGFPAQRPVRSTMSAHWLLERGDFNGDGKPDLVSTNLYPYFDGALALFKARVALGDGNGGLTQTAILAVDGAVSGIGVTDVNGDGKQDVVVSEYYAATSFFLGNGDGTFGPRVPVATCYFNDGLVTGDFNKDGYGDVAFVCNSIIYRTTLAVALGSPVGLVRTPEIPLAVNANQTWTLRIGDVNGDGNQDIALGGFDYFAADQSCLPDAICYTQRSDGPVSYFLGLGSGVFEPVTRGAPVGRFFYDLALADLNGDGKDDLVTTMTYDDQVLIQPGKADGTVGPPVTIPTYDYPTVVRVADLTGDGKKDLVMTHGPSILSVHPGTGGFAFGAPTSYAYRSASGELVLGNYAGDARTDVLAGTGTGVEIFTNGA